MIPPPLGIRAVGGATSDNIVLGALWLVTDGADAVTDKSHPCGIWPKHLLRPWFQEVVG